MRSINKIKCLLAVFSILILLLYFYEKNITPNLHDQHSTKYIDKPHIVNFQRNLTNNDRHKQMYIAVVACGDRVQETLNMLKSALMFSSRPLYFIIIAEDNLILTFKEKLIEWQSLANVRFQFKILRLTFPVEAQAEWKILFKPCASQRLFLPSVLADIDAVIYVDTDTLFLAPVEMVWDHFYKMNSSQLAALAPEHEDANVGWYNRFARHPYYGKFGVNSGVMLMNLTRMRSFKWLDYVVPIYKKYKLNITWGDQDIINIIFHFHPDKLYIYSCKYNYRPDHCMYMSVCKTAEKEGAVVVHGSRGFFHSEKQPVFPAIYRSFEEYQIGTDKYTNFLLPMESYLDLTTDSHCGRVKGIFLQNMKQIIHEEERRR